MSAPSPTTDRLARRPDDPTRAVVAALDRGGFDPRPTGLDKWKARCPAHDDRNPSLSIGGGDDGRVLLHCFAGCSSADIIAALGMTMADLFPPAPARPWTADMSRDQDKPRVASTPDAVLGKIISKNGTPTAHWIYQEADGTEAFRVYRFDFADPETGRPNKTYRPVYPTGEGWVMGDPPGSLPLYGLPGLALARRVYVVEGEKCADLTRTLGVAATTSAHGAQSSHKTDWSPLAGREVVIVPDAGRAGEGCALAIARQLAELEPRPVVKVVRLPGLAEGEDIEQWRERLPESRGSDGARAELERLVKAAPSLDLTKGDTPAPADETDVSDEGLADFLGNPPPLRLVRAELLPVPTMNERLIPEPLRAWLKDIAERASCPLDLPAVSGLISIATVVGRRCAIRPKRYDDWTVVPNLWGAGVLPPGELKTHCLGEPKRPLLRLEMEAQDRHAKALEEHAIQKKVAEARGAAIESEMKTVARKLKRGATQEERENQDAELTALATEAMPKPDSDPPTPPRYVVNDATVEKLGALLAENPRGLLQFRDELTGFLYSLEKEGHENDRPFYFYCIGSPSRHKPLDVMPL